MLAIELANNPVYHEKTKHVEADCHFIHENMEKDVVLVQVPTEKQLVDFLTKVVNKAKLQFVLFKLGIINICAHLRREVGMGVVS